MATIAPIGKSFYYDSNGEPLNGGKVFTYEAGTSTPKVTYTTQDEITANANPIVLDSDGGANIWLGDGGYKFIVTNSADVELFTADNLGGNSSAAFGSSVNILTSNTPITDLFSNSINICETPITLSLLSTDSAGEGYYFTVQNNSGGSVVIDPDGGELVNGASTYSFKDETGGIVVCNGSQWFIVLSTGGLGELAYLDDINDNSVTTAKIFDASVTFAKLSTDLFISSLSEVLTTATNKLARISDLFDYVELKAVIQRQTAVTLSGSSYDFTGIPSNVNRVTIVCSDLPSITLVTNQIQIGDSGGIEETGYRSSSSYGATGNALASSSTGFLLNPEGATATGNNCDFTFTLNRHGNKWVSHSTYDIVGACPSGSGSKELTGDLTQLRIKPSSGVLAGTATISWEF